MSRSFTNGLILILALFALLTSAAKSTNSCPKLRPRSNSDTSRYIIILGSEKAQSHFDFLKNCYGKRVEKVDHGPCSTDPDVISDFSAPGCITGYTGNFGSEETNELSKLPEVFIVEKDTKVQKTDENWMRVVRDLRKKKMRKSPPHDSHKKKAPPHDSHKKKAPPHDPKAQNVPQYNTQSNAPADLNRISQANLPLNGNYVYPTSAGQGVNVGGKIYGVAKKVNLYAVKVLNSQGAGDLSTVIVGLNYVLQLHKKYPNQNTVVNNSLSLVAAVNSLTNNGVHVVTAAGNGYGADSCTYSPANAPTAISVGSIESDDSVSNFSNLGKCVTLFAPDGPNGKISTLEESGTSQSSPHVAGTVALVIAQHGNMSPTNMKNYLINLSTKNVITGLDSTTPNRLLRIPHS
ncbi:315_t:CDS:2 [Acaulospora colombiana]|uniref:315_t:CDS:1 n=1 Tax=Acaulospora colombiana TaxID=27376 RepID=A0ACA9L4E3_9GLOM|nr:315_t:CDS:2 [Acaulospora colombiana]